MKIEVSKYRLMLELVEDMRSKLPNKYTIRETGDGIVACPYDMYSIKPRKIFAFARDSVAWVYFNEKIIEVNDKCLYDFLYKWGCAHDFKTIKKNWPGVADEK